MSSIHTNIAASATQAALQQSQVAKARDASKHQQELASQKLKELLEEHLESVEDSTEADAQQMRVRDEDTDQQQKRRKRQHEDSQQQAQTYKDAEGETHIDIEA